MIDINPAALEVLGCTREDALGRRTVELGLWQDEQERTEAIRRLQKDGSFSFRREICIQSDQGRKRYLDIRLEVIEIDDRPHLLVMGSDVTRYRKALDELEDKRRALRQLVELHEHDRQITAYEIHDGLAQSLFGAKCQIEASLSQTATANPTASETLAEGLRLLDGAVKETRRLINGLRPSVLEEFGVVPAIEQLIDDRAGPQSPKVTLVHELGDLRLAPPLENAVFRLVQESLNNACQHSGSDRIQVELNLCNDHLEIRVEDWGKGFEASEIGSDCFGLRGIAERARLLGGSSKLESSPGKGDSHPRRTPVTGSTGRSGAVSDNRRSAEQPTVRLACPCGGELLITLCQAGCLLPCHECGQSFPPGGK